ncbi:MAG: ribosome-binding factor A [Bacteroidia bacterium]|nr:ribosome-binding factor A [Bacteroidia bacterium]MCX7763494.1 ribosome-binding factor A [Bacteroidia bacterium]MDW8057392.1 ribosome-binding factor A [Bacteroidia bacterium]
MARPPNLRQQRFAAEVKRILSDIIREAIEELPELSGLLVELSDVRVTADLQQVRAYLLVSPAQKQEFVVRLLNQHQKTIRYRLAQQIRNQVKVMPTVRFFADEVELRARRVEEILKNLPPPGKDENPNS